MFSSTHLGEVMETTCNQCKSRFRLTEKQLQQAYGKVCCSECGSVFNAMTTLQNFEGELPPDYFEKQLESDLNWEGYLMFNPSEVLSHCNADLDRVISSLNLTRGRRRINFTHIEIGQQ